MILQFRKIESVILKNQREIAMRKSLVLLALAASVGATSPASPYINSITKAGGHHGATGSFVLLELFTSEGCSSCPPADDLLGEIARRARKTGTPIYALSFHVDYWNYIGWTDPYSDTAFSERQRQYAAAFNNSQIYTPQIVVNGQDAFVGSNRSKLEAAVKSELNGPPVRPITIELVKNPGKNSTLSYAVSDLPENTVLHLAIVERNLSQKVNRGENSGRTLRHQNVVRYFETVGKREGLISFELPQDVREENCSVIAYIQNHLNMTVLAATQIDF